MSIGTRNYLIGYALVLGGLLCLAVRQLHVEWAVNPQYSYGWGVPGLVLYLFWKRWQDRPPTQPAPPGKCFGRVVLGLLAVLFPIRLVQEANPDWRLMSWLLALVTTALALSTLRYAGGRPWLKHFLVPIVFLLTAVPWPMQMEHGLIQSLMRGVAAVTTEGMNLLGIAATRHGNLIELANGTVGVNEACSGIRSIQTILMGAILIGELHRLPTVRRGLLIVLGLGGAVLMNLLRTCLLTWICAWRGIDAQVAWHDPAGYLTLGLSLALVGALGLWFKRIPSADRAAVNPDTPSHKPIEEPRPSIPQSSSIHQPTNPATPFLHPRPLSPKLVFALVGWLIIIEAGTEAWYRSHELMAPDGLGWTVVWPRRDPGFQAGQLPARVRVILRCDEGESVSWRRPDGSEWTMFFLQWRAGRMASALAHGHTPDVCLPANGFKSLGRLGLTTVRVEDLELPFNTYLFEGHGRRYYVFFCLMDEGGAMTSAQAAKAAQSYLSELDRARRFRAVWDGVRHRGQQVLEIAMVGYASPSQAQAALQSALPELIRVFKTQS